MLPATREKFNGFQAQLCAAYGVNTLAETLTVDPPKAFLLNETIQKSSEFLKLITIFGQKEKSGDMAIIPAITSLASRTKTQGAGSVQRKPKILSGPVGRQFVCRQTNFDSAVTYDMLDNWAPLSDFQTRLAALITACIALDRLNIGWFGKAALETATEIENVNEGWFHDLKTNMPENFETAAGSDKITIGAGGTYKTVDEAAAMLKSLIPSYKRSGLVVLIGSQLAAFEEAKIYGSFGNTPSEKIHFAGMNKTYGGMPAIVPDTFPEKGLMVVNPKNLAIIYQNSSIRRAVKDNPACDQIENYCSMNEAYKIIDLEACAAFDHDKLELVVA